MAADSFTEQTLLSDAHLHLTDANLTGSDLTDADLADWQHWRQQLSLRGERRLLVLAGTQDWAWAQARHLSLVERETLWLGDAPPQAAESQSIGCPLTATPINKFKTVLGKEYQVVVFNAFSGLHPDALGAVAGTVRAGGVLILLCPTLADWPASGDADLVRYVAEPEQAQSLYSRFLARFIRLLEQDSHWQYWPQGAAFPRLSPPADLSPQASSSPASSSPATNAAPWPPQPDHSGCLNGQQRHALAVLLCSARRRISVILTADRGRGKSSLLGLAADRLISRGLRIMVTAPSPSAVSQVLAHCAQPLDFMAPDALLAARPQIDMLLIDEAAAIPVPLLLDLARHYCCVFASTEHGYEGTGLGFQLKFQPQLLLRQPRSRKLHLHIPARWSASDPLEPLVFRLLALNAQAITPLGSGALRLCWVTQDQLLADETLLGQLFGLLTLAHYQTSPSDLRQLLDAPELHLAVMFRQATPVAVALLITEGQSQRYPLSAELSVEIWRGQRRPRGHLLPQSLAFHGGLREACQFRYHRVMRIVVHPAAQNLGLGSQLLSWIQQQSQPAVPSREQTPAVETPILNGDFIGTSFGASPQLVSFWQANGFRAVRLGQSKDAVSGLQAVMMLWPSSARARHLLPHWQAQFSANLQTEGTLIGAATDLTAAAPTLNTSLYPALTLLPAHTNPERDRHIAHDFAFYHRDLLCDQAALSRFVSCNRPLTPLSATQQQLLAALLARGAHPTLVAKQWQLQGYKAALAQCRQILQAFFTVPSET